MRQINGAVANVGDAFIVKDYRVRIKYVAAG